MYTLCFITRSTGDGFRVSIQYLVCRIVGLSKGGERGVGCFSLGVGR